MRFLVVCLICFTVCGCAATSQSEPTQAESEATWKPTVPIGKLGHPLGTLLTIEGTAMERFTKGHHRFLVVDTVNGEKLEQTVTIWLENIGRRGVPKGGVRCVFTGYETGRMEGSPPAVSEFRGGGESGSQAVWSFWVEFVILSVAEPDSVRQEWEAKLDADDVHF